ncbi:transglycosylase domain-containing protein [Cytophagaceae bacterium ABcell3]|nr:transglycosylase domain-containing protein [Cytophagaceae bacterium ABcell3]
MAKRSKFKYLMIFTWASFITGLSVLILYIYMVSVDFMGLFGPMPSLVVLENPKSEVASELYTSDEVLLGKYFRENRTPVDYDDISPNLINALKATEDSRFEEHSGIDLRGLMRVMIRTGIMRQSNAGGGSTISQQLAKNLFDTRGELYKGRLSSLNSHALNMLIIKTKEWITAVNIERSYTKEEIITMYLNVVDFGSNSFGIKVAAKTFFNTTPDSLDIPQAATLVGLLKAPTTYSPVMNPDNSFGRRNVVIEQMHKYNYLAKTEADSLKQIPLELNYNVENHNKGLATYFRSVVSNYLLAWCRNRGIDLFADGLKIYCTIDSRMQKYAENAMAEHMKMLQGKFFEHWEGRNPWIDDDGKEIKNFIENAAQRTPRFKSLQVKHGDDTKKIYEEMNKPVNMRVFSWEGEKDTLMSPMDSIRYYKHFLHTGFMAMDPASGHIKAWVGGIDHRHFKYDHVKQGRRQPGSTFKPLVYATALDYGYSPCYEMVDAPVSFQTGDENETWTPKNADNKFSGEPYTLRKAMANSVNSITAGLIKKVGPNAVVDMAKRLGIESRLDPVPALCLGVSDVSVYELIGAYSAFVNEGVYTKPFFIARIEDKHGNVLQEFIPETKEAINEETAHLMVHMLKGATQEAGGTALGLHRYGLLGPDNEIGGKTGTSQNASDGWFVGITPKLVGGAWVGGEDRSIHFRTMEMGQGARMAMPIWAGFMQKVYEDESLEVKRQKFPQPSKPLSVEVDCKKFKEKNEEDEEDEDDYEIDGYDLDGFRD